MSQLAASERMLVPEVRRATMIAAHLAREEMGSKCAREFDQLLFGLGDKQGKKGRRRARGKIGLGVDSSDSRNDSRQSSCMLGSDSSIETSESSSIYVVGSPSRCSSLGTRQSLWSKSCESYARLSVSTNNGSSRQNIGSCKSPNGKRVRRKKRQRRNNHSCTCRAPWSPCSPNSPSVLNEKGQTKAKIKGEVSLASIASSSHKVYMTAQEKRVSAARQRKITMSVYKRVAEEQRFQHELDLTPQIPHLSDQILWELGDLCPKVTSIKLCGWKNVSVSGLRSISLGFGERLESLDLSGAPLNDEMVTMLTTRFFHLTNLVFKDCGLLSNTSCRTITESCNATLVSLDLTRCTRISEDGLMWLAGQIGATSMPCSKLESLSLEGCPKIKDRGLIALGRGCKKLRYVNFTGCSLVTDRGIAGLANGCHQLEVVNLAGLSNLSDRSLIALGASSPGSLRSLNVARCVKVTDLGLQAFAKCSKLQALNVAGCVQISEQGIFFVVGHNKAMAMLNVTGCELVTQRGLSEMLRGLEFGELAQSYTGFKPKANVADLKITAQMQLVFDDASRKISAAIRGHGTRLRLGREKAAKIAQAAAGVVQRWWRGHMARTIFWRAKRHKRCTEAAETLQLWWAGRIGRKLRLALRAKQERDEQNSKHAVKFQAAYRGKVVRAMYPEVRAAVQLLRDERWAEKLEKVTVRMQARARGKLSQTMNRAQREELQQRVTDMNHAAVVIQSLVRGYLSVLSVARRRQWFKRKFAKQLKAATDIQKVVRGRIIGMRKYCERLAEHHAWLEKLSLCAKTIQRIRRGQIGRALYLLRKREHERKVAAATAIQKVFRGAIVPPWPEINLQLSRKHVRERADKLHKIAAEKVRQRMELRGMGLGRDSASEDEDLRAMGAYVEDDEDDDWQEHWDPELRMPFYFSPSRNERTFTPYVPDSFDSMLLDKFVKVQDPYTRVWRNGFISRFNKKKKKHRVEYSQGGGFRDTDHEWLYTKECEARVQVYDDKDDSWSMLRQLRLTYSSSLSKSRQQTDELNASILESLESSQQLSDSTTTTDMLDQPDFVDEHHTVQRFFDEDSGLYYLFNHETGETRWET